MDNFVFVRIRSFYFLLDIPDSGEVIFDHQQFFSAGMLSGILSGDTCTLEELSEIFGTRITFTHARYRVLVGKDYCLLTPRTSVLRKRQLATIRTEAEQRVTKFQLVTRDRLIRALYSADTSLNEYVCAWADYFFLDHFSLWIYNKYTKAFTCASASFDMVRSYIFEAEESSLNDVLANDFETECREPANLPVPIKSSQPPIGTVSIDDMQTLNRIKLTLGYDGTIGILSLYSRHPNYAMEEKNCIEIRNSIETKYLQVRQQAHQEMDQINQQFIESYRAGRLNQFLFSIVCQVRQSFQCEACSIFLLDKASDSLDLVASCDNRVHGEPDQSYSYPLDCGLPTAEVFNTQSMAFSYDLAEDDPDNKGYAEVMDFPPANWIGAPLMSAGECLGVLRVRNKHEVAKNGVKSIVNFRSGDFMNLLALCINLGNLIRIEGLFMETEARLNETYANLNEMNDFNKVFLHEIRTPISKFTMAPEIIKRTLGKKNLSKTELEKVMIQLDDIQVMGDRLEFIAKTFNFNQIVTRRHFSVLSVLRDIVFPVINITRAYLRKQYEIDIDLDTTGLQSSRVYGDKTLLNLVFNILIDNAGKYSVGTRRPISVSGGYHPQGDDFDIVVSNYGLPIHEDEQANLFENGVRGDEAIRQGIGGTGIGLHLAQRILHEGNGDLILASLKDPVSFIMRVPIKPSIKSESG